MNLNEAKEFIAPVITQNDVTWADIGAGTGLFTTAICHLVEKAEVYAVDKSPHALWSLSAPPGSTIHVVEGDFSSKMDIPMVDAILMANTLHYARDPLQVVRNVIDHLKEDGKFVLIEYETTRSNQWVPYPIVFERFTEICEQAALPKPLQLDVRPSHYGHDHIYLAVVSMHE